MDPSQIDLPPLGVASLLKNYHLTPKKGLGQNFLADSSALRRIVESAEIPAGGCVLEVGPGLGSLTRYLAQVARKVVAVELDGEMIPILKEVLAPWKNVEIIQNDILNTDPAALMGENGYYVVANIPYYITSAVIRHLLEAKIKPARLVLTVQREVADRICAKPGDMSLLALSVQVYGAPRVATRIPAGAFYPPPKIDSAAVRVDLYHEPLIPAAWLDDFFRLAKAGFSQKRKMLRNSLAGGLGISNEQAAGLLEHAAIEGTRRAETLTLSEWSALTAVWRQVKTG